MVKGTHIYKNNNSWGIREGRGTQKRLKARSAETDRSSGTRKKKQRRRTVGTGVEKTVSRGKWERAGKQAEASCQHGGGAKLEKKQSAQRGTQAKDEGGGTRKQADGEARRARARHGRDGQQH